MPAIAGCNLREQLPGHLHPCLEDAAFDSVRVIVFTRAWHELGPPATAWEAMAVPSWSGYGYGGQLCPPGCDFPASWNSPSCGWPGIQPQGIMQRLHRGRQGLGSLTPSQQLCQSPTGAPIRAHNEMEGTPWREDAGNRSLDSSWDTCGSCADFGRPHPTMAAETALTLSTELCPPVPAERSRSAHWVWSPMGARAGPEHPLCARPG